MNHRNKVLFLSVTPLDLENTSKYFEFLINTQTEICNVFCNGNPVREICNKYYRLDDLHFAKSKRIEEVGIFDSYEKSVSKKHKLASFKRFLRDEHGKAILKSLEKQLIEIVRLEKPDCVVLDFTYYSFLNKVGLKVCKHENVPLLISLNDDFLLKKNVCNGLFYLLQQNHCRTVFIKALHYPKTKLMFISKKMRDAYEEKFSISSSNSLVIYPSASIEKQNMVEGNGDAVYFGNIGVGRINTLCKLSLVLKDKYNKGLHLYPSNYSRKDLLKINNSGIMLHERLPFKELVGELSKYSVVILAESFNKSDIAKVYYSVSTKTGDVLNLNKKVLCIAPHESGICSLFNELNIQYCCESINEEKICKTMDKLLKNKMPVLEENVVSYFSLEQNRQRFLNFAFSKNEDAKESLC